MIKKLFFFFLFVGICGLYSCKENKTIPQENFYFKSIKVNGNQSGGFYAKNLNLLPEFEIAFSAPVDQNSAKKTIQILEFGSSTPIKLDFEFKNLDSIISVKNTDKLKSITDYNLLVGGDLSSAKKTLLRSNVKLGITTGLDTVDVFPRITDEALLDLVQKQTFKYFWDFGHPVSGLARERNTSGDVCTSGGTGFGIMAMVVATERNFISRKQSIERITKIVDFLKNTTKSYHGAFPHWINGATGATVPFSTYDNGGDLVETSYLFQGLLTARQYFDQSNTEETELRKKINEIWEAVEWDWYTQSQDKLYWHWSENYGWKMNMPIVGWNECLITYFLAAASPTHPIKRSIYDQCWAKSDHFQTNNTYYGITIPLGYDYGGPLFFSQYSFLGLDPRDLKDKYADYWKQNTAHTMVNYNYCLANPKDYRGYNKNCWGLTASDSNNGYSAHSPTNDLGVISPTAALSAMPYAPELSKQALRYFYYKLGDKTFREFGFTDAFNLTNIWFADSFLAIDQGPIICMIENHRTGLLWKYFMSANEVKNAKQVLGFE